MVISDRDFVAKVLDELEKVNYPFSQYKFCRQDGALKYLGKGSFSYVYEMQDRENSEKHFALKIIGFQKVTDDTEHFKKTVRLQHLLSEQSPYIVRIIDTRELFISLDEDGSLVSVREDESEDGLRVQFILMEKLEHVILKERFRSVRVGRPDLEKEESVLKFAMQIGQAIFTAHQNNILHRDIKLENIFWDDSEKCYKLGDFGIAKFVENGNAQTRVYTGGYGAPEIENQLHGRYNATADIYSFGVTVYLLLNELQFPGSDSYSAVPAQYSQDFIFPAPKHASVYMARVIRKMCSYEKEDRFQSMKEVLSVLNQAGEKMIISEAMPVELADLQTDTYHTDWEKPQDKKRKIEENNTEKRLRKKVVEREAQEQYHFNCSVYAGILTILFVLLYMGMQADLAIASGWQIWALAGIAIMEALLMQIKVLDRVFGVMAVVACVYSMYMIGISLPQIVLTGTLLLGIQEVILSGAFSSIIWMLLVSFEKNSLFDMVIHYDLCWLVIILIMLALKLVVQSTMKFKKSTEWGDKEIGGLWATFSIIMMITGGVLMLLHQFIGITIPETIAQIHLIRVGVVLLVIACISTGIDNRTDEFIREKE